MNRSTQEATLTVAEQIAEDARTYGVDEAEAGAWALEGAIDAERSARSLVTRRAGIMAKQRRRYANAMASEQAKTDPRVQGIQAGAVKSRERQLREALDQLAAAAHVLADTQAAAG